jgi:WD40 repeat protein
MGPITSISINNCQDDNSNLLNGLLASSSYDWSSKIWNPKLSQNYLTSFEGDDYVYDSQWNPLNPTLLATGDNEGLVKLWDITYDFESPLYQV